MKLRQANNRMQKHYPDILQTMSEISNPGLIALLATGLVEIDGCVLLHGLLDKAHVQPSDFPDKTGYECFVNHVHVEEFVRIDVVVAAVSFLNQISKLLLQHYPNRHFQGILTAADVTCIVRFHAIRPGEHWLSNDLDAYEEDVCVIDL